MMDPASIVTIISLTIATFDQLLKLGERTAELISDIRAFDDVSCQSKLLSDLSRNFPFLLQAYQVVTAYRVDCR